MRKPGSEDTYWCQKKLETFLAEIVYFAMAANELGLFSFMLFIENHESLKFQCS
jgi:hypothetical protein